MDILVLNEKFEAVAVIDSYESLTWADRYYEYSDFELYTAISEELLTYVRQDYYIQNRESEHLMIIDEILIESSAENGNTLKVAGKSLESILNRRIVWGQVTLSGDLQSAIYKIIYESIIDPTISQRKISNFVFEWSTDLAITNLTVYAQYTGENLYDLISKLCKDNNIGFKITLNDTNQFVFKLYAGVDRSYEQTVNPYVIFSSKFDNLIQSNYIESKAPLKNVTLVAGEDTQSTSSATERKYTTIGNVSGLYRRELFTDARDISSTDGDQTLTSSEYLDLLTQRGRENLAENNEIISFEGELEPNSAFKINEDYFIGDIVQIADEYSHTARVRVLEVVTADEKDGISVIPTFATILEEGA